MNSKEKISTQNKRKNRQKKLTKIEDEKWELPSLKKKESDDSDDELKNLSESIDLSSAYVRSIVNKNKKENIKPEVDRSWIVSAGNSVDVDSDTSGFTVVQKPSKIKKEAQKNVKSAEGYGMEAYDMILQNEKLIASEYLSYALDLDPNDYRHYFNRSYCYLCTGQYKEALNDCGKLTANYNSPIQLAQIKCRQGKIYCAMGNYNLAEKCFKECLSLVPNSISVKCEMLRMKIIQLEKQGYAENDVMNVLNGHLNMDVKNAEAVLSSTYSPTNRKKYDSNNNNNNNMTIDFKDELYESDPEDIPSKFLSTVNFYENQQDEIWKASKIPSTSTSPDGRNKPTTKITQGVKVAHVVAPVKKVAPQPVQTNINTRAVWFGAVDRNLGNITESMLRRRFSKFGPVLSVCINPGASFGFVNFVDETSARKALETKQVNVGDKILYVKWNKRN